MTTGPLDGVRMLEFSIILSAPFGGMQLADLGADIIKVEQPPLGDPSRRGMGGTLPGASKGWQVLDRGRRALTVDLSTSAGKQIIHRLIPSIDVVLINYRPGVAKRLGIDYETLSTIRPDLIYAEISGYGFEGPLAQLAASDMTASAYGGVLGLTDAYEEDGAPRSLHPPISGDMPAGLAMALGVVSALYHRERTGEGQLVRTSLLRAAMVMTGTSNSVDPVQDPGSRDLLIDAMDRAREEGASFDGLIRARRGIRPLNLYFRTFRAKDGGLAMGALTPANRAAIRRTLGLQGADTDEPDYNPNDPEHRAKTEARLEEIRQILLTATVQEWVDRFDTEGAPVGPVHFPEELLDDPQASLHYTVVEHPLSGSTYQVAPIVELSRTPTAVQRYAPLLGEHNAEVLRDIGYSDEEIAALHEQGVLAVG